jgi:hypothetical protein
MPKRVSKTTALKDALHASRAVNIELSGILRGINNRKSELEHQVLYLDRVLDDALAVAGNMSIMFPASTMEVEAPWDAPTIDVPEYLGPAPGQFVSLDTQLTMRVHRLNKLIANIQPDHLRRAMHVKVTYKNKPYAYAINDDEWHSMPKHILMDRISREIAGMLIKEHV